MLILTLILPALSQGPHYSQNSLLNELGFHTTSFPKLSGSQTKVRDTLTMSALEFSEY